MEITRAAVLEAPRSLRLVDRPMPTPGRGEAVVRVAATAVCHTDLSIYTGAHPGVRYPVVLGHETTGVVDSVGAGVEHLRPGQRVLVDPIIACGACDICGRGLGHLCRRAGLLGREFEGSLAEHQLLPAANCAPLPGHLPADAATLVETLATVHHAQARAGVDAGDTVVVFGQGVSGLLFTQLARHAGAARVIGVSRSAFKLELSRRLGAEHVVDAGRQDVLAEIARLTDGRGADLAIDTAGEPGVLGQAVEVVRPGGRVLVYSISHRPLSDVDAFPFYLKELTVYGSRALTPADLARSIELAAGGAIRLDGFITARYPLPRVAEAFADYERDPGRVLRLVIMPDASAPPPRHQV